MAPDLVVALAAAGLAWHECLLLVTAALAAQRLELLRMERAAPLDTWRVGARCLVAGSAGLFGSVVIAMILLAAAAGWWQPSHDHPVLTVGLIAGVGAVITAMQIPAVLVPSRADPPDRSFVTAVPVEFAQLRTCPAA